MKALPAFVAVAFVGFATPALASETCQPVAGRAELAPATLDQTLKAAGFTRAGAWEREQGCFEVKARTADGRRVEVVLDPYRGTIRRHAGEDRERRRGREEAAR